MHITDPRLMEIRNTSPGKEILQLNSVKKSAVNWELLLALPCCWLENPGGQKSFPEHGRSWDFPLGKQPHPEGWWVLAKPCLHACCQPREAPYLYAHFHGIALWGVLQTRGGMIQQPTEPLPC